MKLCDYCGFVIKDNDSKCFNCSMAVPGREVSVTKTSTSISKKNVSQSIPRRSIFSYIPKKFLALLIVGGLLASPQTQLLFDEGLDYWEQMNTSYYTIPEEIVIHYIRNFEVYLKEGDKAEYSLTISMPKNRSVETQSGLEDWQIIDGLQTTPAYSLNPEGRMLWKDNLTSDERHTITIEYTAIIDIIRPEIKMADSGLVEDIPEGFDEYLVDEWLIEPSNEEIQILAAQLSNGTGGNVIHILKNIFDYIEENYKYQKASVPKSCLDTIVGKVGDCDDFSILFSSIARAAGIPTWLEFGIIPGYMETQNGCDLGDWGGHAWVNAVVPHKDGTVTIVNIDIANSYFLWFPPYRISDWVDDGNGESLDSYYYLFSSKGVNSEATYIENSYVSECSVNGNIKLTNLDIDL